MTQIPDGTHTAVVDRIEDGVAALVVDRPIDTASESNAQTEESNGSNDADDRPDRIGELLLDPERLPPEARRADAVVELTVTDGTIRSITADPEATRERKEAAQSRFDRLSRRPDEDG